MREASTIVEFRVGIAKKNPPKRVSARLPATGTGTGTGLIPTGIGTKSPFIKSCGHGDEVFALWRPTKPPFLYPIYID